MRVLVAEDDGFFQKVLEQVLTPEYELVVVNDGNEAWAMIQSSDAPMLAILDWVMPGLSGPEICRKVRARKSSMYLIILTARNNEADILSGLRAGADDYITKPPIPAELLARVRVGERILALQKALEAQTAVQDQVSIPVIHRGKSSAECSPSTQFLSPSKLCGAEVHPETEPSQSSCSAENVSLARRSTIDSPEDSHS